jgi:hypothetical protein
VFWVISVYFNIRNTLPKSGTFLLGHPVYIMWRNRPCGRHRTTGGKVIHHLPHARSVETQKPRNIHATIVSGVFSVPNRGLPSSAGLFRAAPRALLGDTVNDGPRNSTEGSCDLRDDTRNSTERCFLPHVRLGVYRRD